MYTDVDGKTQYTEEDCGIFNADACDICYDTNQTHDQTPATTKLSLVGTDMKMVFDSDYSINGGFVDFNWQCRSYGNDICPFKYDGSADSGCYAQSGLWSPGKCQVASSLNGDKIEYGVRLSSPGNEPGYEKIEFYVDTVASATCQYDRDVEIDADGFFINQEDVNAEDSKYGSLLKNFKCHFLNKSPDDHEQCQ